MTEFTMTLAGVRIAASTFFETTRSFCQEYLSEGEPDFWVTLEEDDLKLELQRSARERVREGLQPIRYSPVYMEELALYRKIVDKMLDYQTFLFHGSVISVDGEGYLFTAKSGTGKSTHTGLWRNLFGDRAVMVNDDKPLLRVTEEGVLVCGTPWDGKHHLSNNIMVPLKAVTILQRGTENRIRRITLQEALPMLLQQSHRPSDPAQMPRFLKLLEKLSEKTGLFCLECNMEPEAAEVAYRGITGKDVRL